MRRRVLRFFYLVAGIILLAAVTFAVNGGSRAASQGQPDSSGLDSGGGNICSTSIQRLSNSESQEWTRERMLAAQPYPLETHNVEHDISLQLNPSNGEPGFIPGSAPANVQLEFSVDQETNSLAQTTASGYDYPAPFVQYQNFDSYQVYPYSTVGVLFFKQYGVDYRCSAASIGNSAIWTAGHCIHKGDNNPAGWSTDIVFAPAYKNGSMPFGVWSALDDGLCTKVSWYQSGQFGDLRHDFGGAVLNEWNNQKISDVVGSLGFAYNQISGLHWLNIAYPSSAPFDGKTQQICAGSFAYEDTSAPAPSPVAMGCDMTQGSSGGPWILNFSGQFSQTNFINGNNSYRYSYHPKELFSPYFGDAAKILYDALISG